MSREGLKEVSRVGQRIIRTVCGRIDPMRAVFSILWLAAYQGLALYSFCQGLGMAEAAEASHCEPRQQMVCPLTSDPAAEAADRCRERCLLNRQNDAVAPGQVQLAPPSLDGNVARIESAPAGLVAPRPRWLTERSTGPPSGCAFYLANCTFLI